jgi:hypothetical protein
VWRRNAVDKGSSSTAGENAVTNTVESRHDSSLNTAVTSDHQEDRNRYGYANQGSVASNLHSRHKEDKYCRHFTRYGNGRPPLLQTAYVRMSICRTFHAPG